MQTKVSVELHPTELELIYRLRQIRYGTIEKLAVRNGLPDSFHVVVQRIQLGKEEAMLNPQTGDLIESPEIDLNPKESN